MIEKGNPMKKALSVLLAAMLLISAITVLSLPAMAAAPSDYVGYAAARVEKAELSGVPNLLKFEADGAESYQITNAAGLVELSKLVRAGETFAGKTIYLANDIDMAKINDFLPIGYNDLTYFAGKFDGQGHVIENLVINSYEKGSVVSGKRQVYVGLFGYLAEGAEIRNLVLGEHCYVSYFGPADVSYVAALVGGMRSLGGKSVLIDNCMSMAGVHGVHYAAGIVARVDGGFGNTPNTIRNTTNTGDILNAGTVAGFAAHVAGKLTVENSRNTGTVTLNCKRGELDTAGAGFIAIPEKADITVINGCINNGTVEGPEYIGAFYGAMSYNDNRVSDSTNYGKINATRDRGGARSGIVGGKADGVEILTENLVDKEGKKDTSLAQMDVITPQYPNGDTTVDPSVSDTQAGTDDSANQEAGGCRSAVSGGAFLLLSLCAVELTRKKGERR